MKLQECNPVIRLTQDVMNGFTGFNSLNGIKTICLNDVIDRCLDEDEAINKVTKTIAAAQKNYGLM